MYFCNQDVVLCISKNTPSFLLFATIKKQQFLINEAMCNNQCNYLIRHIIRSSSKTCTALVLMSVSTVPATLRSGKKTLSTKISTPARRTVDASRLWTRLEEDNCMGICVKWKLFRKLINFRSLCSITYHIHLHWHILDSWTS